MTRVGNLLAAVFISLFLGPASLLPAPAASSPAAAPFVWWSIEPADYPADGRARLNLVLEVSRPELKLNNPESLYRLTRLDRFNQEGDREQPVALRRGQEARPDGKLALALDIGGSAKVGVFARAGIKGRSYFAQTTLYVFGRGQADDSAAIRLAKPLAWPEFKTTSDGEFYWFSRPGRNLDHGPGKGRWRLSPLGRRPNGWHIWPGRQSFFPTSRRFTFWKRRA